MTVVAAVLLALAVLVWPAPGRRGPAAAHPSDDEGPAAGPVDVATAMDLLALALGGGSGVTESIEVVADEVGGPVGSRLRVVSAALRWGMDEQTAWAHLPSAWAPAARAMSMAGLAGVPPADLLAAAATDLRRAEEGRLEVAASKLGVALVVPLGLAFLPAFVVMTVLPVVLALAQQVLGGS